MNASMKRQCQPCTACCDGWVRMNIGGTEVYPGRPCPHSTSKGCADYAQRPVEPCREFACGWVIENSPLPEWMNPARAGAIVLFGKRIWRGHAVDLAVPVGQIIPARALNWLFAFVQEHGRLLLYTEQLLQGNVPQKQQQVYAFGPPEFQNDMLSVQAQGVLLDMGNGRG